MRAALISIAGQPRIAASGAPLCLAGKTLARRQLDFALAAGCELVIALGDGADPEAIALRHAAEGAGVRFQTIREGHGLLGAVRAADELLVLTPGLLPEAPTALEQLKKGNLVLTLPAAQGVAAGFERIDLEQAWAGALVVPGALVERLAELSADSDPGAALLRIALQARVPEWRLTEELLAEGGWSMVGGDALPASEAAWLKRNLAPAPARAVSGRLARLALRPLAARLLAHGQAPAAFFAAFALLLGAGVGAAAYGLAAAGFALAALGALVGEFAVVLRRLSAAPFAPKRRPFPNTLVVDLALTACGVLAIEQDWPHRLFPPLVLLGLLRALRPEVWPNAAAVLGDRAVLAVLLAFAAAFGLAEPAIMLAGLALIALEAAQPPARRG